MFSINKMKYLSNFFLDEKKNEKDKINNNDDVIEIDENDDNDDDYLDKKKYLFLESDNNPLNKTFGDFNKVDNKYKIHLCIYKVNTECEIPFLQYLFDTSRTAEFIFISDFQCPVFSNNLDENTYFMNQCLTMLLENLKLDSDFGIDLFDNMYKGFIEYDESNIFVIFEYISDIEISKNNKWFILDEILYKDKQIEPIILSFFEKYDYMTELLRPNVKDEYEILPLPSLMFSYNGDNEESIIDNTTSISWLGDHNYFISESSEIIKHRYAVFTNNANYILKDINNITDKQRDYYMAKNEEQDITTIYFFNNNIQLWCIKSKKNFTRIV